MVLEDYKHILSFLLTILADISRKRTEPKRIFTDNGCKNLENTSVGYYLCRAVERIAIAISVVYIEILVQPCAIFG
jgi:hypothetical protein